MRIKTKPSVTKDGDCELGEEMSNFYNAYNYVYVIQNLNKKSRQRLGRFEIFDQVQIITRKEDEKMVTFLRDRLTSLCAGWDQIAGGATGCVYFSAFNLE